ncbi:hypothetical protein SSX86_025230 [Deinandra increscens subsp. villosa]|uniref:RING-type E3 ubiquitin transferase n=1 Tax=Deinandra increscens subsp. villosa TaxID=3103831 RepID=A0AAP0CFU1_9ASTR
MVLTLSTPYKTRKIRFRPFKPPNMPRRFRMLTGRNSTTTAAAPPSPEPDLNSNFVVILAAFLCAIICVLGLLAVARCTWIRRISAVVTTGRTDQTPNAAAANRGLKKKFLKTLPKITYSSETVIEKVSDCAICLTEFSAGDEIRVLPRCGHGFHVTCIDIWFRSHSSCPSCRQILSPAMRCEKCGELPAAEVAGSQITTAGETSG